MSESNGAPPLDAAIMTALADESTSADAFAGLIRQVDAALEGNDRAAEAEHSRALALDCPDPEKARETLRKIELGTDRLEAALPRLQEAHRRAHAREQAVIWCEEYERIADRRDALTRELIEVYPAAVKTLVGLFERITAFDKDEVDRINSTAPAGEKARLRGVELAARDLTGFTDIQPPIAKLLQLPRPEETSALAFPPRPADFSVQAAELVARAMAGRSQAYGPSWHEVREAENERRRADGARIQANIDRKNEESKRALIEDQLRAARGE